MKFLNQKFGPLVLLVIQPTTFCNLDCDYCYLPNRDVKKTLSLDLLEPIFRNVFTSPYVNREFSVVWHAGEPLTMPIKFYQEALIKIQNLSQKFNIKKYPFFHSMQTNATLINQNWCDLIKEFKIRIGVSLDGPDFLHDQHRKTRKNTGSYASTMRGVSYLKKNDISFSVITVLTSNSLDYPDEIFNFFLENNLTRIGFNIEEYEGNNQKSSLDQSAIAHKYRAFMKRFYELNKTHNFKLRVREFERIKKNILTGANLELGQFKPYTIISIDYQGNFMTFSPELLSLPSEKYGDFVLGNVSNMSFEEATKTEKFIQINNDIVSGIKLCKQSCQYFTLCGGGSPGNKYFENGSFDSSETMYCLYTQKILVDLILQKLEYSLGLY